MNIVTTNDSPISATRIARASRKALCRPNQKSDRSSSVMNIAECKVSIPAPLAVNCLEKSATTSVTIPITPMIEAIWVVISPTIKKIVTPAPNCTLKL